MKNVMTRAWEIAKDAAKNFGGKAVQYIAGALKMAWAEAKKVITLGSSVTWEVERFVEGNVLSLPGSSNKSKTWVAVINDTHEKWGLNRNFVNYDGAANGICDWKLESDKLYSFKWDRNTDETFVIIRNNVLEQLTKKEAMQLFA